MERGSASWCSWCYQRAEHRKIEDAELLGIRRALFECSNCGMPTASCRTPRCDKMACASDEVSHQLCATHRGEIASFEAQSALISDPCDFPKLFEHSDGDVNVRATVKRTAFFAGTFVAAVPIAKLSATVAGGVYGSRVLGLSGAAARSAGLAKFGGGALGVGGKGVAGGLLRLRGMGTALSSARSWQVSNAYFSDLFGDLSIDRIREGHDPALICIDGFLTQTDREEDTEASNEEWLKGLGEHYSGHAVYRVRWPSKRKRNAVAAAVKAATGTIVPSAIGTAVSKASFAAAAALKSGPAAVTGLAAVAATNPWSVALMNSKKTGLLLAEMLSRCDRRSFVLIGHSLGARACVFALRRLAKRRAAQSSSKIVDVHLMGGAIDARDASFWKPVAGVITGQLFNYYTTNDQVLQYAYRVGALSFRGSAIGRCEIPTDETTQQKIISRDVGAQGVGGHCEYHKNMRSFLAT
jgi:Protein of unknown function (DUF726)